MKNGAKPLSREERDNKKVKIDADEFMAHVNSLIPPKGEEVDKKLILKKAKK